ncbi:MAG: DNA alkylation repair protein [Gemella sp.]|nr:DNA alkylation repair protein [Gemella sp.]
MDLSKQVLKNNMSNNLKDLIKIFESNANPQNSEAMKAYMRNQFEFLGIKMPDRKPLYKDYFKEAKKSKQIDWDFVDECYKSDYREMQQLACAYLKHMKEYLVPSDLPKLKILVESKSWWDTIDTLDRTVGDIALRNPDVNKTLLKWSKDENFWVRRIAIDHQLGRKDKTDTKLLEKILVNNFGSKEFFINKAIGWALRDYSKTNPEWVRSFLEKYSEKMANLSIREASKYI